MLKINGAKISECVYKKADDSKNLLLRVNDFNVFSPNDYALPICFKKFTCDINACVILGYSM
jgi:hypothetical protein